MDADGSATLRYYYTLERHTVKFNPGEVGGDTVSYVLKYSAGIPVPQMAAKGYTFAGWSADGTTTVTPALSMSTADLSYTALWTKEADTEYRVEYYVQQADGRYTLQHMFKDKILTGATHAEVTLREQIVGDGKTADEA